MAIRILPPEVAARIAAGEVIERPASAVKELLENALDAGASRITVEVVRGGLESIRVSDDGCGLAAEEMETAFARHATSKLEDGEDLSRIVTLGFRGEALPSMAAVAEVEMTSRPPVALSAGWLRLGPEMETERGTRGAPAGTSITLRRLFSRQPARRKFLRSPSSETNAVAAIVTQYALAYPHVRFSLIVDGRQGLLTPGGGDRREALAAVYGADVAAAMLRVDGESVGVRVEGLVSPPDVSRSTRSYMSLFVNHRWIQNRRLTFAIEEAYQGLLMTGRHPIAVLDLRVPYEEVDVNVHPAKSEVRFRDESAVFGAVQKAVRQALLERAPVPGTAHMRSLRLDPQATALPLWRHAVAMEARPTARAIPADQGRTNGTAEAVTPGGGLPVLRVIGQFGSAYVVAEGPDGMYLIDQHAAHERVLYERFCRMRRERSPEVQGLLSPVTVEIPARQRALLEEQRDGLLDHGFQMETFGEGAYLLRSLPKTLNGSDPVRAVQEFLDLMLEEGEGDRRDRVAMTLACHAAVRAGKTMALDEMRELIRLLEESDAPNTCPHGRPTMIHMSADTLAREFGRR